MSSIYTIKKQKHMVTLTLLAILTSISTEINASDLIGENVGTLYLSGENSITAGTTFYNYDSEYDNLNGGFLYNASGFGVTSLINNYGVLRNWYPENYIFGPNTPFKSVFSNGDNYGAGTFINKAGSMLLGGSIIYNGNNFGTGVLNNEVGAILRSTDLYNGSNSGTGFLSNSGTWQNGGFITYNGFNSGTGVINNSGLISNAVEGTAYGSIVNGSSSGNGRLDNAGVIESYGIYNGFAEYIFDESTGNYVLNGGTKGTVNNSNTLSLERALFNGYNSVGIFNNSGIVSELPSGYFDLTIINGYSLEGIGLINNSGKIFSNYEFYNGYSGGSGTIKNENSGLISNSGHIYNSYQDSRIFNEGLVENTGTINNNGVVDNVGIIKNSGDFVSSGSIIGAGTFVQTTGSLLLNGNMYQTNIDIQGGALSGSGSIGAATGIHIGSEATINPGNSPGTLTVVGDLLLAGALNIELTGTRTGQFDTLNVTGLTSFSSSSKVMFDFLDGYLPTQGQSFIFLNSSGGFDHLNLAMFGFNDNFNGNWHISNSNNQLTLFIDTVPIPGAAWLFSSVLAGIVGLRKLRNNFLTKTG